MEKKNSSENLKMFKDENSKQKDQINLLERDLLQERTSFEEKSSEIQRIRNEYESISSNLNQKSKTIEGVIEGGDIIASTHFKDVKNTRTSFEYRFLKKGD